MDRAAHRLSEPDAEGRVMAVSDEPQPGPRPIPIDR